jgi:antitoxin HicB
MKRNDAERRPLAELLALHYPVTLHPEPDGGFVAEVEDLPGCLTQGESLAEVYDRIEEARRLWIETAYAHGDEIPLPATDESFSGRLLLRLPRALHGRLAREARRQDVSLNQYIVALLAEGSVRGDLVRLATEVERLRAELDLAHSDRRRGGLDRLVVHRAG